MLYGPCLRHRLFIVRYGASTGDFQGLTDTAHALRHIANEDAESITGEATSLIGRTQYAIIGRLLAAALFIFAIGHPLGTYINNHRAHLMEKLRLHNRLELLKYAMREGIITADA